MTKEKMQILHIDPKKALQEKNRLKRLRKDGVYIDDSSSKVMGANIQRLEERLLRERPQTPPPPQERNNQLFDYFKRNGELKLHHDMLAYEISRPIDLSVTQNKKIATRTRSAILCDRINALKKRHYRLDLIIGKISIREHPIFSPEDRCAMELKELYEEYERVTSLGMIPFYESRLQALSK